MDVQYTDIHISTLYATVLHLKALHCTAFILGQDEGDTVKYTPSAC